MSPISVNTDSYTRKIIPSKEQEQETASEQVCDPQKWMVSVWLCGDREQSVAGQILVMPPSSGTEESARPATTITCYPCYSVTFLSTYKGAPALD